MGKVTRRSLLRTSMALGTAGTLARPYIAKAAAKTATVWWVQGFIEEEDVAFKTTVSDYEKASGNKIDYTIIPFAPQRQKIVSAMTSGVVPDLFPNNPVEILALYAWDNKLVDVSDIVETQKSQYSETALLSASATTASRNGVAITPCPILARCGRTTSGGRWSRKRDTKSKTLRKPGMHTTIFSKRCKKSCAYGMSTGWASN